MEVFHNPLNLGNNLIGVIDYMEVSFECLTAAGSHGKIGKFPKSRSEKFYYTRRVISTFYLYETVRIFHVSNNLA